MGHVKGVQVFWYHHDPVLWQMAYTRRDVVKYPDLQQCVPTVRVTVEGTG